MGFLRFLGDSNYRRQLEKLFTRKRGNFPKNPSPAYLALQLENLLDPNPITRKLALEALKAAGIKAAAQLRAALDDPRYQRIDTVSQGAPAPLNTILDLLAPHDETTVVATALKFVDSADSPARRIAAGHLAALRLPETLPAIERCLKDEDMFVRGYTIGGLRSALKHGRLSLSMQAACFEAVERALPILNDYFDGEYFEFLLRLDEGRAIAIFTRPAILSNTFDRLPQLIDVCSKQQVLLPAQEIEALLHESLPLAREDAVWGSPEHAELVRSGAIRHSRVVAAALRHLVLSKGDAIRPLCEQLLSSPHPTISAAALASLQQIAGMTLPLNHVGDIEHARGFAALTQPQRLVFCAHSFEVEVCNGGLSQFFANASGDHVPETLDALRTLAHPEALTALETAIQILGPRSLDRNQNQRLQSFEPHPDAITEQFAPLEAAFYKTADAFRHAINRYALTHADHFRSKA